MTLKINEHDIFIGQKIQDLRKKLGWGLKTLAYKLNISVQQLHKYENSVNKVSASMLYEITKVFNVPIEHFFCSPTNKNTPLNILLIEDDIEDELTIRHAIDEFPKNINLYTIHEAEKSIEFFKQIPTSNANLFKPDLILVELYSSKVNGLKILKTIKQTRYLNHIPVIILTNVHTQEEIAQSYSLQAGGCLIKACSKNKLKDQITSLLSYWTQLVKLPKTL